MEEFNRFVILAQSDRFTVTELCEQFGISRKTGYKHLERYAAAGRSRSDMGWSAGRRGAG
ncbi:MAG: helix-turn-helix domain-containing protein [Opitutaceae bacterium]|nr:helix-turn-helix domain-containing protein [Opitutaceae bacterium]